jgi:hypothetical protein
VSRRSAVSRECKTKAPFVPIYCEKPQGVDLITR